MPTIPVKLKKTLSILNLPKELHERGLLYRHRHPTFFWIKEMTTIESFQLASETDLEETDPMSCAFQFGFSFYLLSSALEFLNLKTIGDGIVKTVGLENTSSELLTNAEISEFKLQLEIRALKALKPYLNSTGKSRLEYLCPEPKPRLKIGII